MGEVGAEAEEGTEAVEGIIIQVIRLTHVLGTLPTFSLFCCFVSLRADAFCIKMNRGRGGYRGRGGPPVY